MELTKNLLSARPHDGLPAAKLPRPEPSFEVLGDRFTLSQGLRYAKDIGGLFSDVKTVGTMTANLVKLPPSLTKYLGTSNGIGLAGGVIGLGVDLYGAHKIFQDPHSTRKDKVVDVAHIAISDVLGTAAGSMPLFTSIHNPIAMSVYMGGQILGVGCDIYKTIYDVKKHARDRAFQES